MTKDSIMQYLKEFFGIKSESELNKAMATAERLNIGIMTKGVKKDDKQSCKMIALNVMSPRKKAVNKFVYCKNILLKYSNSFAIRWYLC